jgi:hypothetical protein
LVSISARRLLQWSVGQAPCALVEVYEKYAGGSWSYVSSTVHTLTTLIALPTSESCAA